jgi:hypothetical protein
MPELRTSLVIDLAGNLQRRALAAQRAVGGIGRTGTASFSRMNRQIAGSSSGLLAFGARSFALIGGGLALRSAARAAMATEERIERLGVQAKRSSGDVQALWDRIAGPEGVALRPDINVDPKRVLSAVEEIVERTGDLAFAEDNLANLARAIQATGAEGEAIGALAAELQKMDIRSPQAVAEALDILNAQGKQGAFTLQNLAALGPRVFAAYSASGRGGLQAVREMGAALQMMRMGTGSSEMAASAFEATMRTLQNADKVKVLQRNGIRVFEDDETTLRPINELMAELVRATGGRMTLLGQVFDAEALRAFTAAAGEFQRTGKLGRLEQFFQVKASGETAADAARIAKTASAVTTAAASAVGKRIEEGITPAMKTGAEFVRTAMEEGFAAAWEKNVLAPWRANRAAPALPLSEQARLAAEAGVDLGPSGFERFAGPGGGQPRAGGVPLSYTVEALRQALGQAAPEGKVTIEIRAEPGTRARVTGLQGRGLDVDTGPMMPESAR